jgi:hypothetical protein
LEISVEIEIPGRDGWMDKMVEVWEAFGRFEDFGF